VIHQLPVTPDTLWLRLLGRGNVQLQAIQEVNKLPLDAPERANALELFSNLKATLAATQPTDPDDEDLIMQLSPIYLEQLQDAKQQGEKRGKQQGVAAVILRRIQRRFGDLPMAVREQVLELSIEQLYSLEESIDTFAGVDDLLSWLG
jgi:hypothetical protein